MSLDLFTTPPPDVALEIDSAHVAAARLAVRGGRPVIAAHASEALPPGTVVPGLAALNMPDVPAVARAIERVLSELGGSKPSRVALVVPDTVAKVSLLRLEKVPAKSADLREIVKWQLKKSSPFPLEQAVLSLSPGGGADGEEFVATVARADVIHQYEQACVMAGVHAGLIDLATFSVINGILRGSAAASGGAPIARGTPTGDWLLVHVADTYLSLAVLRGASLLFFRNRSEAAEGTLADLMHQTAMYYEDRLQGAGFTRVLIAGGTRLPGGHEPVRRAVEARIGITVEPVDPREAAALQDRIDAAPELLDRLAPLVGLLVREGKAA
jgi:Tfp pilus assembly PilM family ATPase